MADNYIEKKYEEYEMKKAAWLKKQKHAIKRKTTIHPDQAQEEKRSDTNQDTSGITSYRK